MHVERANRVLVVSRHEHDPTRNVVAERLEDAEPVLVWHLDVEEQEIGTELPNETHRFFPVRRLPDHVHRRMLGEQREHDLARGRLVVHHHRANQHRRAWRALSLHGRHRRSIGHSIHQPR